MRQACLLIYDIPEDNGIITNPYVVNTLRPRAAHIQGSGWVIFEEDVPAGFQQELLDAGCACEIVPFDMRACQQLMEMAANAIASDIKSTVRNHRASVENYVNQMVTSRTPPVQAYIQCRKKVAPVLKKMGRRLKQYQQAATTFGLSTDDVGLATATNALASIQKAMLERTGTYLQAAAELEKKNPGDLFARAIRQGVKVPAFILADYADEAGIESAPKIRKLF